MTRSLEGSWQNQHGSVLRIDEVRSDGSLRGTFRPAVGLARGGTFPIVGMASDDIFSFTVSFGAQGITSWVGHREKSRPEELTTTWILVIGAADAREPAWKRTLTGGDVFRSGDHALRVERSEGVSFSVPDVP